MHGKTKNKSFNDKYKKEVKNKRYNSNDKLSVEPYSIIPKRKTERNFKKTIFKINIQIYYI